MCWASVVANDDDADDYYDVGVGDDLKLFVVRYGAGSVGYGLSYEKVGSNFNEGCEFVYVCGTELGDSGKNVKCGFGVEPEFGEKCLE